MREFEDYGVEYLFSYISVKGYMSNWMMIFVSATEASVLLMQAYRHELLEAYECCINYKRTGKDAELTQVTKNLKQNFRCVLGLYLRNGA